MTRSALRMVIAAMLALLSTQAGMPSVRLVAAFDAIWQTRDAKSQRAEQQVPRKVRRKVPAESQRQIVTCRSLATSDPHLVLLFQLPPPQSSFTA